MPTRQSRPPAERVRDRLRPLAGRAATDLPRGYQRLGKVLLLRLPSSLSPFGPRVGELYREEMGVETVLGFEGGVEGELRRPRVRILAGERTETVHQEEGILWHLDAAAIMFSAGNRSERRRAGELVRPGERVADLFAGIGYFTLPAAKFGHPQVVHAVEKNPRSHAYLLENVRANRVEGTVVPHLGDNRTVALPLGAFDRVFLGYLPSSLPFVPRALELLDGSGGWMHVHLVVSSPKSWAQDAREEVARAVLAAGGEVLESHPRRVKPYGPARTHAVVDARVRPPPAAATAAAAAAASSARG